MRAGIKLQMIPYAGGPSQALSDLIAGRVQIVLDGYGGVGPGIEGGSTKGIAVATTKRLPEFPKLPTVAETLPGLLRRRLERAGGAARDAGRRSSAR